MPHRLPLVLNGYLCDANGTPCIALDSPEWLVWLSDETHCAFHFAHTMGGFTARKETRQRGHGYWVAYRQVNKKLHKTYLGKAGALTKACLCAASEKLAAACQDAP